MPLSLNQAPRVVGSSDRRSKPRRARSRRWLAIWAGIGLLALAFSCRYRWVGVVGPSMRPTYHTGDLLLVDRWAYRQQPPQRSDIVVAEYHHGWIVKRVVGLPGELVEVRNGLVEINGIRESASHEVELGFLDIGAGRLLQDRYAVLGDNRGIEPDAFVHAIVSSDQILGKVVFAITWPRSS